MDCSPEMMPYPWSVYGEQTEEMQFIDLPPVEQVTRGRVLLDLLHVSDEQQQQQQQPAASSFSHRETPLEQEARDNGVQMIVKRTFIEVVPSPTRQSRTRALSDSALGRGQRDRQCKIMPVDLLAEMSEASTDAPSEHEEATSQQWGAEIDPFYWSQNPDAYGMACGVTGDVASSCMAGMMPAGMPGMWMQAGYDEAAGFYPMSGVPMDCMMPWQWAYVDPYAAPTDSQQPFEPALQPTPSAGSSSSPGSEAAQGEEQNMQEHTGPKTTVLLRNLPQEFTRADLLELLEDEGFEGTFDFIYLPMDFGAKVCLGYAFVNFVSGSDAQRCWDIFSGYSDWSSDKVCEVTWGEPCQGLHAHIERYRNSPVMHKSIPEEWKPLIFKDGARLPFPAPTKSITAPKLRRRATRDIQA